MTVQVTLPTFRRFVATVTLIVLPGWLPADDRSTAAPEADIRVAVTRGLQVLEKSARNYPEHRGCFSCHHQTLPMLAVASARERGFEIDEDLFVAQARFTWESFRGRIEPMREGNGIGGKSMTVGYGLWALEIAKWKKDDVTSAMVSFLLKNQNEDGSWSPPSNRPPLEHSNFTCTILAVYYARKYADDDQKADVEKAADRAKEWLLRQEAKTQEDLVSRLGALVLMGSSRADVETERDSILASQHDDGGWAQLSDMKSDAYATGLTLFTLQRIGLPTTHAAYRRGIRFLLGRQDKDGSWFVKSRSKPIQKFFDNGDPHGPDQFISIPATSWATTALTLALPRRKVRRF